MNFRLEILSPHNIHHIAELHHALYRERPHADYFRAKYNTAFLTDKMYGYFAFDGNIAVGFSGVIPALMQYKGETVRTGQVSDLMTHPSYFKHGIFKATIERIYVDLCADNIAFIWGFPNEASFKSTTQKLNWLPTPAMKGYRVPVLNKFSAYCIRKMNRTRYGKNFFQKILEKNLTNEYPIPSLTQLDFIQALRTPDYYKYKSFGGNCFVNLNGVKVWLKLTGALFIGDMDNLSVKELKEFLPLLIQQAKKLGATDIYFQSHPGSVIQQSFDSLFPSFEAWRIACKALRTNLPLEKIGLTMGDLDSF